MNGPLYRFFSEDHRRLEALLDRATRDGVVIEEKAYADFRAGLLRHISMEEKVLFPAAQRFAGGAPLPNLGQIRLDHGALTALLVPPPSKGILAALRAVMAAHDEREECEGGMYDVCERMADGEAESLIEQARKIPEVPVRPHNRLPIAIDAARRTLERAGYRLDDYLESSR